MKHIISVQYVVETVLGVHGMINYVDARTTWMDDIVKQAQWQGITQVCYQRSLGMCHILQSAKPQNAHQDRLLGCAAHRLMDKIQ